MSRTDAASQPRQIAVYRYYFQLHALAESRWRGSLAGRLVVCEGFGRTGAELSLATTIAGGTFLGIEPDSKRLKAAIRDASCDFMVNTLDEALRTLKNEVRKGRPLSVGLLSEIPVTFRVMAERGIQPDLIADTLAFESAETSRRSPDSHQDVEIQAAMRQLAARGAIELDLTDGTKENSRYLNIIWSADKTADLRRLDQVALAWLPPDDTVRRRWLVQAGGTFHRQLGLERVMSVQTDEVDSLLHALRGAAPFLSRVAVRWHESDGAQRTINL